MPTWKVLLIGLLAAVCFTFAMSALLAPMIHDGNQRWVWLGSSLAATVGMTWVFAIFLRYAGRSLDVRPSRGRN